MILVNTSVWIDHFRQGDPTLSRLLGERQIVTHRFVIGELALGNLKNRFDILEALRGLPSALVAGDAEVHAFIERHRFFGSGIGLVDAHLLAATLLTAGTQFWTRDKRLRGIAARLEIDANLDQ